MKMWYLEFTKRVGELINKLIAVKTIAMVVISFAYFPQAEKYGFLGFLTFSVLWLGFVGVRYAEKRLGLLNKIQG